MTKKAHEQPVHLQEAELPEWERAVLESGVTPDSSYITSHFLDPNLVDLTADDDPKTPSRRDFARGGNRGQDHGTRGTVDRYRYHARLARRQGIWSEEHKSPRLPKEADILDQLSEFGSPDPDFVWSKGDYPLDADFATTETVLNESREAAKTHERARLILEDLESGKITKEEAKRRLYEDASDTEKYRLRMLEDEAIMAAGFDDMSGPLEYSRLTGDAKGGALVTDGINPFKEEGVDWLDGFHIVKGDRL